MNHSLFTQQIFMNIQTSESNCEQSLPQYQIMTAFKASPSITNADGFSGVKES